MKRFEVKGMPTRMQDGDRPMKGKDERWEDRPRKVPATVYSRVENKSSKRIKMASSEENSEILTSIRGIITEQLRSLKGESIVGTFSASQALTLHRLASTFAALEAQTEREQSRYDLSQESEDSLEELEESARRLLQK